MFNTISKSKEINENMFQTRPNMGWDKYGTKSGQLWVYTDPYQNQPIAIATYLKI